MSLQLLTMIVGGFTLNSIIRYLSFSLLAVSCRLPTWHVSDNVTVHTY